MRYGLFLSTFLAIAPLAAATSASAETLKDAIALAYDSNPVLQQQRAQLRALDESYVQARAGYRPIVSLSAQGAYNRHDPGGSSAFDTNTGQLSVSASQTLFSGGRTLAAVRDAEAQVMAGRQVLRTTEAQILQQAITAYLDVRRDEQILVVRRNDVIALKSQLGETTAKFEVGALTRTDVAQAKAQYAQTRAALAAADGQLKASRSEYRAVIGHYPGHLDTEPALPGLPATVEQAFDIAENDSPTLLAAALTEQSSQAKVAQARAARMPSVTASASYGATGTLSPFNARQYDKALAVGVTVTQPLYAGGQINSQVRQALELNGVDRFGIEKARRDTVQSVAVAWEDILANKAALTDSLEEREAAQAAFKGVREEFHAGLRTNLDVLIAEQALSTADVAVLTAQHDAYVAQAALLVAIGHLDAKTLGAQVQPYDPKTSFTRVRNADGLITDPLAQAIDTALSINAPPVPDPHRGIGKGSVAASANASSPNP